jgi:wobble nucleotide-excising tRNase
LDVFVKLYSVKQCGGEPLATLWKVNMTNFSEDIQAAERYSGLENDVKNEEQEESHNISRALMYFWRRRRTDHVDIPDAF